jgi:hypothetical protein
MHPVSPPSEEPSADHSTLWRNDLLYTLEKCLLAQANTVRRLRLDPGFNPASAAEEPGKRRKKGRSQVDLAKDILETANSPLHISEIISRIAQVHGRQIDAESLVSALSKRVARKDRFRRTARNTFALLES